MPQRFGLWDDLTAGENLQFMARILRPHNKTGGSPVADQLANYQIADLRDQLAGTLSGGQRQRLALAAATLHQPELLLLDEPTSAVDPKSRRDFWDRLFELADAGTTILVSTHYMDEAERCHSLAIMCEGRIAAAGSPDALIASIDARVFTVAGQSLPALQSQLQSLAWIRGVAQLGSQLHVLTAPDYQNADAELANIARNLDKHAEVRRSAANLEDVFVIATRAAASHG